MTHPQYVTLTLLCTAVYSSDTHYNHSSFFLFVKEKVFLFFVFVSTNAKHSDAQRQPVAIVATTPVDIDLKFFF